MTCSTIGAHVTGTLTVWSSEARTRIGEISSAEQGDGTVRYSAWYIDADQTWQSAGEHTRICKAIQEVRDRRFQALSAYRRGGDAA